MIQVYVIAGISIGLGVGALIMWTMLRRRVISRKIPAQVHAIETKQCLYCGAQMPKDDIYCLMCGRRQ